MYVKQCSGHTKSHSVTRSQDFSGHSLMLVTAKVLFVLNGFSCPKLGHDL